MPTVKSKKTSRRLAIVDDNPSHRTLLGLKATLAGFEPVPLQQTYPNIDDLLRGIRKAQVYGALCDHRLREGNFAGFDGAEAVAALYDKQKPAILVTDYGRVDIETSIRTFRRRIPVLISTSEALPERIIRGLEACEREVVQNEIPISRRPRRALVMIDEVVQSPNGGQVIAFVPQWRANEAVSFPELIVPIRLRAQLKKDRFLIAWVNTDAELNEDLFFENFEQPPDETLPHEPA
jgi:CheY-like chemotaxis protein